MKLEGRKLQQHLNRMHGLYGLGDKTAKEWHALDHKLGAKHQHEEAKRRWRNPKRPRGLAPLGALWYV